MIRSHGRATIIHRDNLEEAVRQAFATETNDTVYVNLLLASRGDDKVLLLEAEKKELQENIVAYVTYDKEAIMLYAHMCSSGEELGRILKDVHFLRNVTLTQKRVEHVVFVTPSAANVTRAELITKYFAAEIY